MAHIEPCHVCEGTGEVPQGIYAVDCPECGGTGEEPDYRIETRLSPYGGPPHYEVVSSGEYPRGSVLEGQYRRVIHAMGTDLAELQVEYPTARTVDTCSAHPLLQPTVPDVPPTGFDPADAGERWDEDY